MNNIQEMDWAEDCWHGHTGMDSSSDFCFPGEKNDENSEKPLPAGPTDEPARDE